MRALVVSDLAYPMSTTGFAVACRIIIDSLLGSGFTVTHLGRGPSDYTPITEWENRVNIIVPPSDDYSGFRTINYICETLAFDVIVFEADPKSIEGWVQHASVRATKIVCHTSVEGAPLLGSPAATLAQIITMGGKVAAYTKFGADALAKAIDSCIAPDSDKIDTTIPIIGLGCDHENFKPLNLSDKIDVRKKLEWNNRIVVMTNGRNGARKRLPALLKAVKIVHLVYPEVLLYLHTSTYEGHNLGGHHLARLKHEWDMDDYVVFPKLMFDGTKGIESWKLIERYQASDIYVNCSGAEGWGIPTTEAAMCGSNIIHPMYAGGWEVCKDFAHGMAIDTFETHSSGAEEAITTPQTISNAILNLIENPSPAPQPTIYTWNTLYGSIKDLVKGVL